MEIKVFDIGKEIHEESLVKVDKTNIKKIFDRIFSPKNTDHIKIDCSIDNESILKQYCLNTDTYDISEFSTKLQLAEQKNDETRNEQITEGYLFIKQDKGELCLLKLENIEVIDKEENYKMKTSFSTEANYYKGCILKEKSQKVVIIDKNKSVAKYWMKKFLQVTPVRDSYQNSTELIQLVNNNTLFADAIKKTSEFQQINDKVVDFIFENRQFDKTLLLNELKASNLIKQKNLEDVYSDASKDVDADFEISNKALTEGFRKVISLSKKTKIVTLDYKRLFKAGIISYADGKVIINVENDFIEKLPEELRNEK
ncbi:hypothetical protein Q2T76_07350 [Lactobacillus sp. YT155]|uniref:hypothetical protein n=1 Tax=Lactobacillus sp. YT155 TaxID=3060955 RepID=UPI00265E76EE|nr:hypothetical protein [Lactobacillus sp. YT155]MDO1605875.1 hypothetical protein [Lactobacillus sp. YT155]